MLDFSKTARPRRFYLPSGIKVFFLFLPWVFVAYGVAALQDFVSFYNNSVEAPARVVFVEPSQETRGIDDARELMAKVGTWPIPSFLYRHENGQFYVGGPIVDASRWHYSHGEFLEIRYNRVRPYQAQPVSILKFWWTPGVFIVGGILAFIALLLAFRAAENPGQPLWQGGRRRKPALNLRRK